MYEHINIHFKCFNVQNKWVLFLILNQNAKALKAKKEEGNQAFKNSNYEAAYQLYTEALAIDPNNIKTNAKLYCNRATAGAKVKNKKHVIFHQRQNLRKYKSWTTALCMNCSNMRTVYIYFFKVPYLHSCLCSVPLLTFINIHSWRNLIKPLKTAQMQSN